MSPDLERVGTNTMEAPHQSVAAVRGLLCPCGVRDAGRSPTSAPQSRTDAHRRESRCASRSGRPVCGRPWGAFGGLGGAAEWHPATRRAAARGKAWGQARLRATKGPKPPAAP